MIEIKGDLWEQKADAICITTNGFLKKSGNCVMGRGCALQVVQRYPGIDFKLGDMIKKGGNHVHAIGKHNEAYILSFPTKHVWWNKSDINLIKRSAFELVKIVNHIGWYKIIVPRPGCSNGKLDWISEVRPVLVGILDDRFYIISYEWEK